MTRGEADKALGLRLTSKFSLHGSGGRGRQNLEEMAEVKKLRWVMDGSFWDLDASTPRTVDGSARPVPGDPVPLGVSRGARLSRPKQIDFLQRFMAAPFVPSYTGGPKGSSPGLSLQRVLAVPLGENW